MSFFNKLSKGKKKAQRPIYACDPFASASLVKGSFTRIVSLPKLVEENEWFASNVFDFYHFVSHFYDIVAEYCTPQSCPCMNAQGVEYSWVDSNTKKNLKLPAPAYVDCTLTSVERILNDELAFPTKAGQEFPPNFHAVVKSVFVKLFRILAHLYHAHYDIILHVSAEAHLNTLLAHFLSFAKHFDLLDKKELAPMAEIMSVMESEGRIV